MGRRLDEAFLRGGQVGVRSLRFGSERQRDGLAPGRRLGAVDRAARVGRKAAATLAPGPQLKGELPLRKCK